MPNLFFFHFSVDDFGLGLLLRQQQVSNPFIRSFILVDTIQSQFLRKVFTQATANI